MRGWTLPLALSFVLAGCLAAGPAQQDRPAGPGAWLLSCPEARAVDTCNMELSGSGVNEFDVAANPIDPRNAIIVANDYGAGEGTGLPVDTYGLWGSWWHTSDGGTSWTKGVLPGRILDYESSLWGYGYVGDLVADYGPDGTAHVVGIAYDSNPAGYRNALFWTSSADGGATFADPVRIDSQTTEFVFHDKPAIYVDDELIVIVWLFRDNEAGQRALAEPEPGDMRIAISRDGGASWDARPFSHGDSGISASVARSPDGTLHVAWRSYDPLGIRYAQSADAGDTWTEPSLVLALHNASIATPNAPYRSFVLPALAATPDGALHLVVSPRDADGESRVTYVRSADGGRTWSIDRLDGGGDDTSRFLATLEADSDGRLVAGWLDRRDDPDDEDYHFWTAVSSDGGRTWDEQRVSSAASPPGSTNFIGDYLGLGISGDRVYAAWPDIRAEDGSRLYAAALELADVAAGPSP